MARELGKSFDEVAEMDPWELAHLIALMRLEPSAAEVVNLCNAVLCSVVANSAFGSKRKARGHHFLLSFDDMATHKPPSGEVQRARWMAWAAAANGTPTGKPREKGKK